MAQYSIQQFTNDIFGNVRVLIINNQPWFVGNDVGSILGYSRPRKAILDHVDDRDKQVVPIWDPLGGTQNTTVINESGLYSLVFSSKLPIAKEFTHWVTSEVLPTMRQIGFNESIKALQQYNMNLQNELIKVSSQYDNQQICFNNQSIDHAFVCGERDIYKNNIKNASFLTEEQKEKLLDLGDYYE